MANHQWNEMISPRVIMNITAVRSVLSAIVSVTVQSPVALNANCAAPVPVRLSVVSSTPEPEGGVNVMDAAFAKSPTQSSPE